MSNRIIKDSITTSETLALLSGDEERHFFRLITKADDYGRFDARPHVIRAGLYAAMLDQVPTSESERRTLSLASAGLISLYDVDGRRYGQITTWEKHQRVRAKVSKFPPPPPLDSIGGHLLSDDSTRQHAPRPATSGALILNPESRIQNPLPPAVPLFQGDTTHANQETNVSEASTEPKPQPDGNSQSKSQPKRAKTTARALPSLTLTLEQRETLAAKWGDRLPDVSERIEAALNHTAVKKAINVKLYVDNWLRNDAQRMSSMAAALAEGINHLSPVRRNGTGPPARAGPMVEASTEELTPAEIERDKRLEEQLDGWRRIAAAKRAAAAAKAGAGS